MRTIMMIQLMAMMMIFSFHKFMKLEGNSLGTSKQLDTFGFIAAEMTRKQVEKEQSDRIFLQSSGLSFQLMDDGMESLKWLRFLWILILQLIFIKIFFSFQQNNLASS